MISLDLYKNCRLCPRSCAVDRVADARGVCGMGSALRISRAAPHYWEEPCISGTRGSGAVFFTGCSLKCSFCQNQKISRARDVVDNNRRIHFHESRSSDSLLSTKEKPCAVGREVSADELADIFLGLQEQGVHNINLVTATHFVPGVVQALDKAKQQGLKIPVVWNSSGYESLETLRMLDGLIDIYLPDCKYVSSELSGRYSGAPDYFEVCALALSEMVRQTGEPLFFSSGAEPVGRKDYERAFISAQEYNAWIMEGAADDDYTGPLMARGTIVRHLALPGGAEDSKRVISFLHETFGDKIYLSLMAQYTPISTTVETAENMAPKVVEAPEDTKSSRAECNRTEQLCLELKRGLREEEYEALAEYCLELGVENAFLQGMETADESFIPSWDG